MVKVLLTSLKDIVFHKYRSAIAKFAPSLDRMKGNFWSSRFFYYLRHLGADCGFYQNESAKDTTRMVR